MSAITANSSPRQMRLDDTASIVSRPAVSVSKIVAVVALAALSLLINWVLFPFPIALAVSAIEVIAFSLCCLGEDVCNSSSTVRSESPRSPFLRPIFSPVISPFRVYQPPVCAAPTRTIFQPAAIDLRPRETVGDGHINFTAPSLPRPVPVSSGWDFRPRESVGDGHLNHTSPIRPAARMPSPPSIAIDPRSREPVGRRSPITAPPVINSQQQPVLRETTINMNQPEREPVGRRR